MKDWKESLKEFNIVNECKDFKWIDTHSHYNMKKINKKEIIDEQLNTNEKIITLGTNMNTNLETLKLISLYESLYGMIGFFPNDCFELESDVVGKQKADDNWLVFKKQLTNQKIVGIGEIGLDYHWDKFGTFSGLKAREYQNKWVRNQLNLAKELNKPVSFHSRDCKEDTIKLFNEYEKVKGVIHCFSYDMKTADYFLNKELYLGIGGTSTYKSNNELKEVLKNTPLDRLLLETDAPYLSPSPVRRETNVSKYITYVIDNICEIKGIDREIVIKETNKNAYNLFKF